MRFPDRLCALLASVTLAGPVLAQAPAERGWPQWRGPTGNGVAPHAKPPTEWDAARNIRWKAEVPGAGHATPIIWNDRIYLLTAVPVAASAPTAEPPAKGGPRASDAHFRPTAQDAPPSGERRDRRPSGPPRSQTPDEALAFTVLALNRADGSTAWRRPVAEERPHEGAHPTATFASASPVTDGERLYAFFGSRGVHCLDLDGNVVWSKRLGAMRTRNSFGEGASPALHGDTLVITWDHEGEDFIVALDKRTGQERWRGARDEPTTWSSPRIVEVGGKPQVITAGTNQCVAYDLATGEPVWRTGGLTANVIPTPVYQDGMVILMSGFRGAAIKAIRLERARGELGAGHEAIAWTADEKTPYVPSPLLADGLLYYFDNNRPILSCRDAKSGELRFGPERVDGLENVYASPLAANGHVYLVGRSGQTTVIRQAPSYEVVAVNRLDDEFNASPVAVDGELYLRGRKTLYCIAAQ